MNRMHRFGSALFHVGLTGAFVAFLTLAPFAQAEKYLWVPIAVLVVGGVIAGVGYVIQQTFDDRPRASDMPDEPPPTPSDRPPNP